MGGTSSQAVHPDIPQCEHNYETGPGKGECHSGGGSYQHKYLKYKSKYLALKNSN